MELFDAGILAKQLISQYVPQYSFGWNSLKTVNGQCNYAKKTIFLSRHLTPLRTKEAVTTTIMHEIAHALTPGSRHGRLWKQQMLRFGYSPDRCSHDEIDRSSFSNWKATCQYCGKISYMIRKPRVAKACGPCCKGKYDSKYDLTWHRI